MKTCTLCGDRKSLDEFHRRANRYRSECKICACAARRAAHHKKMRDPVRVMSERKRDRDRKWRKYREDPVWRESQKAKGRKRHSPTHPYDTIYKRVQYAVQIGQLVPAENCSRCGHDFSEHKREAHHADYSKPLEVEWLCQPCHSQEHWKPAPALLSTKLWGRNEILTIR